MRGKYYKRNISLEGPTHLSDLKIRETPSFAAGASGVLTTLKHSLKEMGVFRSTNALLHINQKNGFDCPSCAWPDPEKPSRVGEYCENGAKALADEATKTVLKPDFFKEHSVEVLSHWSDFELNQLGRLTEPMVLYENSVHYEPISWEGAFEMIADELRELKDPNEAIFYTSGRSSNEAAFLYGSFARALGTNNLPDCSNMCHESSGVALSETLGIGKGSVTLEDLYGAEVIIIAGQNPGTNHPRMLSALEKCKENGGRIISINPLEEAGLVNFKNPQKAKGWVGKGEPMADLHLAVNINQDIPLVKLILKKLAKLEAETGGVFDREFLATKTEGYESLIQDLQHYPEDTLLELCGVAEERIDAAVEYLSRAKKIVVCWAMGLTQHKNGVETIREYVNLL
ncbi:MAG: molybdopterin-dependent oxidoreductase, partial [Eudoraea sp.]|nr:molybdopterin-dependent oxidoreductase [Eudoraea sp.]